MQTQIDLNSPEFLQQLKDAALTVADKSTNLEESEPAMQLASIASSMLVSIRSTEKFLAAIEARNKVKNETPELNEV